MIISWDALHYNDNTVHILCYDVVTQHLCLMKRKLHTTASQVVLYQTICFKFILCFFSPTLLQFQLVADLFQDNKESSASSSSSSKSSRINVRSAKPTPKLPNKEHRKTVGHQVSPFNSTRAFGQEYSMSLSQSRF